MTLCNAYLIKGYLIDKNPPPEIRDAIDAVIALLGAKTGEMANLPIPSLFSPPPWEPQIPMPAEPDQPKQRRSWSPEKRAEAAERMRAMQAKRKAGRLRHDAEEESADPGEF